MKLETKMRSYITFLLLAFVLPLALFFLACTSSPDRFTIEGPYTVYESPVKPVDKSFETIQKMEEYARNVCKAHRVEKLNKTDMPPTPFTSDGCSMSPDSDWFSENGSWVSCCMEHDISYWCGGTKQDRMDADNKLEQCIAKKGYPVYGWLANNLGVQTGGHPLWPTSFRWRYGWPWPYNYDPEK